MRDTLPAPVARPLLQSEVHGKQTIGNSDGRRGRQLVTIPVLKSCVLGNGTEWMHAPPRPASRVPEDYLLCRRKPGRGHGKEAGEELL